MGYSLEREIFNQLDNSLILIGSDFTIEFANKAAERIIHKSSDEVIQKKCHRIFYNRPDNCKKCPIHDLTKNSKTSTQGDYNCMGRKLQLSASVVDPTQETFLINIKHDLGSPSIKEAHRIAELAGQLGDAVISIQQGVAGVTGEKFFPVIVKSLARALNAEYAFVGLLTGKQKQEVQTISFYNSGEIGSNFSYKLKNTPCEDVFNVHMNIVAENVRKQYPNNKLLEELDIEGFIGVALTNSKGLPIGILVILFKRPIRNIEMATNVTDVFSARAGAEIERMQTEKELANANEKFRSIAENLPDVIFRVDTQFRGIYANEKVEEYAGITPEYFVGRKLTALGLQDQFTKNRIDDLKKVVKHKESIRTIVSANALKGVRVLEWSMIPEFDEKGEVQSILNLVRDLTKARRMEMELNYLFNLSVDLICLADLSGKFIKLNPSWELLLGYAENDLLSKSFYTYIHPDDVKKTKEEFTQKLKDNQTVYNFENRYKCRNGSYKWLSWVAQPYGDSEKVFCIARDITEQKQNIKDLVLAKDKAEEADRLKTAFLANMSHEIRTPMNAIVGFSTLLKRQGLSYDKRLYYSNVIEARSKDLLSIIHDILDISKIESEQIQIQEEEFSINEFLEELYQDFTQKMKNNPNNNLELKIRKPKFKVSDRISNDRVRMKQVMSNLIDNAIKFTSEGQVRFGAAPQTNKLLFYVSDTGIGIPKNKQKTIFERFRQVENALTRQYGGNGLGLAISQALAQLMGGSIWVDSEEGTGSTFYFTIPNLSVSDDIEADKQPVRIGTEINFDKRQVLIADSDAISSKFLRLVLKQLGANPVLAKSGKKTIELLKQSNKYELLIFDANLKDIKGFELMKQVRKISKNVPAISLSSLYTPDALSRCKEVGCSEHLSKPILVDDLLSSIKRVLPVVKTKKSG